LIICFSFASAAIAGAQRLPFAPHSIGTTSDKPDRHAIGKMTRIQQSNTLADARGSAQSRDRQGAIMYELRIARISVRLEAFPLV